MINRIFMILVFVSFSLMTHAQNLKVETFKALDGDISAKNCKDCGLLRVWTTGNIVEIEGDNIGAPVLKNGSEKWIYLKEGSRDINLFFHKHIPISLSFRDYGIKKIKSNVTYLLVLTENGERPDLSSKPDPSIKRMEFPAKDEFELGLAYLKGLNGHKIDYEKAKNLISMSADKGNGDAQFYLGLMYHSGIGVDKNPQEGNRWYEKAAENMQLDALRELGRKYVEGHDIEKDVVYGAFMTLIAADGGHVPAMNDMGYYFSKGIGYDQNKMEALKYYQMAADRGDAIAMSNLAKVYYNAEGVSQDLVKSAEYFEKASRLGDAQSQYNLGLLYEKGWGVEKDMTQAIKWWEKAAEQGHESATKALIKIGLLK